GSNHLVRKSLLNISSDHENTTVVPDLIEGGLSLADLRLARDVVETWAIEVPIDDELIRSHLKHVLGGASIIRVFLADYTQFMSVLGCHGRTVSVVFDAQVSDRIVQPEKYASGIAGCF